MYATLQTAYWLPWQWYLATSLGWDLLNLLPRRAPISFSISSCLTYLLWLIHYGEKILKWFLLIQFWMVYHRFKMDFNTDSGMIQTEMIMKLFKLVIQKPFKLNWIWSYSNCSDSGVIKTELIQKQLYYNFRVSWIWLSFEKYFQLMFIIIMNRFRIIFQ